MPGIILDHISSLPPARESPASDVVFAKLPIELILQIFYLSKDFNDAIALSKSCKFMQMIFQTQFDRIYLALAPRCLPCYDEAMALAKLQLGHGVSDEYRSDLTATLRTNHKIVFRAARHALARDNVQSAVLNWLTKQLAFRQAFDRPVRKSDHDRLPAELDDFCKAAIAVDYLINRLLLASVKERQQIIAEVSSGKSRTSLKRLRDSLTLKGYSYSTEELELYLVTDHSRWSEVLKEVLSRTTIGRGRRVI